MRGEYINTVLSTVAHRDHGKVLEYDSRDYIVENRDIGNKSEAISDGWKNNYFRLKRSLQGALTSNAIGRQFLTWCSCVWKSLVGKLEVYFPVFSEPLEGRRLSSAN